MAYGVQVLLREWRAPETAPQSGNSWDAKNEATTDVVKCPPLFVTSHDKSSSGVPRHYITASYHFLALSGYDAQLSWSYFRNCFQLSLFPHIT